MHIFTAHEAAELKQQNTNLYQHFCHLHIFGTADRYIKRYTVVEKGTKKTRRKWP